jgi:4-aminobutyrate aminotransferase-like enzyme
MGSSREIARRYAAATSSAMAATAVFRTGRDGYVEDLDGARYVDFISGYGVVSTGWQRDEILSALERQLRSACFAPPWLPTSEAVELAEALLAACPPSVHTCARATGGAEANEVVLKALNLHRGGTVLTLERAYHGGTGHTLALSDTAAFGLPPPPKGQPSPHVPPAYCYRCPYGKTYPGCSLECAEAIERKVEQCPEITAFLLEPVLGSGGVIIPPRAYFDAVADICRRRNLVLILDEVMTGCGRLGTFTAAEGYGLRPQALTLAKGLGGGYVPIGAALLDRELATSLARYEDVSATLAWTPLACAAALANVRLIQEQRLPARAAALGAELLDGLGEICARQLPAHVGEVRGKGLMIGIELVADRDSKAPAPALGRRVALECWRSGLMIGTSWDWQTLIVLPPLSIDAPTVQDGLDRFEAALGRVARRGRTAG